MSQSGYKNTNKKRNVNQRKESNARSNYRKGGRGDYHKKSLRYGSDSLVARISNPKREESIDDIKLDIEKIEKDIQFEIKQIRSIKLGL
ncbi:MAG TPA: hypothetical protein DCE11_03625 [Ruminiclostridium sp.]|nr:hypothetical protein [Clostridiaceae bacterium]HAA25197.1 hypothetical protein [Ruminiclostridium sp.]